MAVEAPQTIIHMRHPDVQTTGQATLRAFENVWQRKGWERIDEEEAVTPLDLVNPESDHYVGDRSSGSLSSLSKAQLQARAEDQGVDIHRADGSDKTKSELVADLGG